MENWVNQIVRTENGSLSAMGDFDFYHKYILVIAPPFSFLIQHCDCPPRTGDHRR
jgi:hypothetical protein